VTKADIVVKVTGFFLTVTIQGDTVINDRFVHAVIPDESNWQIDTDPIGGPTARRLWLTVMKRESSAKTFWKKILSKDLLEDDPTVSGMGADLLKKTYAVDPDNVSNIQAALSHAQKKDQ
jgi:hypothetical protein